MNTRTKELTLTALMAAIICVLGPLSVPLPFSPVPISLTMIGIYLAVYAVGMWRGTVAFLVYLLLGLVGLPVFSGFTGGPAKLLGPTGGYLIGFIFMALICGWFIAKFACKLVPSFVGMVLGTIVCYVFGTVWLAYQAGMSFYAALAAGVLPFIIGDLVKMVIAAVIGPQVRRQLARAGLTTK